MLRILNYKLLRPFFYKAILQHFLKGVEVILDIGCGYGIFTAVAHRYMHLVIGYDIDVKAFKCCLV
ncbi:MAG: hypothetical protein DRP08_05135 [Candidatus Aenigmatarchaeota archaeon]|nr:MAG: hypothetical protein DRP08_05135 [Candidatus Aenigmarchaeota archaeon]